MKKVITIFLVAICSVNSMAGLTESGSGGGSGSSSSDQILDSVQASKGLPFLSMFAYANNYEDKTRGYSSSSINQGEQDFLGREMFFTVAEIRPSIHFYRYDTSEFNLNFAVELNILKDMPDKINSRGSGDSTYIPGLEYNFNMHISPQERYGWDEESFYVLHNKDISVSNNFHMLNAEVNQVYTSLNSSLREGQENMHMQWTYNGSFLGATPEEADEYGKIFMESVPEEYAVYIVPEPATLGLISIGSLFILRKRK